MPPFGEGRLFCLNAMYPAPTDDQIRAILAKHRLPGGPVEASPYEGSVNYVRMVGDRCVRVLKEEDYASDIYTEVVSVPAVRAAGGRVPELLVFDDARDVVPGLVSIYRRLPGLPLGECAQVSDLTGIYREMGREIALWQTGVTAIEDPNDWLDKPRLDDAWACYERNADRLSPAERTWTEATIRRLEGAKTGPLKFVHWDLHAHNVLVHDGRFEAIIDWGDAGWGEAAINYHCLPAHMLPVLLEPLGEVDHDFVGRCLYAVLAYALNDVHREGYPDQPYRNGGHARWRNLEALYRQVLPSGWREWLGDPPPASI